MLFVVSTLCGCTVEAGGSRIGTAKDFLFDGGSWQVRWMVVDTGGWLTGRKILIHPSAIGLNAAAPSSGLALPMMRMGPDLTLSVRLTAEQLENSPEIGDDEPVSKPIEQRLFDFFGWDPFWGASYLAANASAAAASAPVYLAEAEAGTAASRPEDAAAHLCSVTDIAGYHVLATDGDIGHVENLLADDAGWDIRYLIVATRNWWPGRHVLLAPFAVQDIDRPERHVAVDVTRAQVQASPPWDPATVIDQVAERQLHRHYGWPGYGW